MNAPADYDRDAAFALDVEASWIAHGRDIVRDMVGKDRAAEVQVELAPRGYRFFTEHGEVYVYEVADDFRFQRRACRRVPTRWACLTRRTRPLPAGVSVRSILLGTE